VQVIQKNYQQKIKTLNTHINVSRFKELATNYFDKQIFDLIEYGFPLDINTKDFIPSKEAKNHPSALNYIEHVKNYIIEEMNEGAILGPYESLPYDNVHVSPLMTRPKNENNRRVIVDLSYPYEYGRSVNSVICPDIYLGTAYGLKLPTVDTICDIINNTPGEVKLFKIDLARAFRPLSIDPADIVNLGLEVEGQFFLDTSLPFGWRSGTLACQRVTDCVRYILASKGVVVANYIDDFIGICPESVAEHQFLVTLNLLKELNLTVSKDKTIKPDCRVTCLGIDIDCKEGRLYIPKIKLDDIIRVCGEYMNKHVITRTQIQSLIGSLIFMHKAIKPARIFINRILALLRQIKHNRQSIEDDDDMRRDLKWFVECAVVCNGSVKIDKNFYPHITMYLDASSAGLGAYWENNVYQLSLDGSFQANIAYYEAVNIVVAIKTWGHTLQGKRIKVWCDNSAAVAVINLGRGHNSSMQVCFTGGSPGALQIHHPTTVAKQELPHHEQVWKKNVELEP
jgi:hypothetical protein